MTQWVYDEDAIQRPSLEPGGDGVRSRSSSGAFASATTSFGGVGSLISRALEPGDRFTCCCIAGRWGTFTGVPSVDLGREVGPGGDASLISRALALRGTLTHSVTLVSKGDNASMNLL